MWGGDVQRDSQGSTQDLEWMLTELLPGLAFSSPHTLPCPSVLTTSSLECSHISIYGRFIPLGMSSFLMSGLDFRKGGAVSMCVQQGLGFSGQEI